MNQKRMSLKICLSLQYIQWLISFLSPFKYENLVRINKGILDYMSSLDITTEQIYGFTFMYQPN